MSSPQNSVDSQRTQVDPDERRSSDGRVIPLVPDSAAQSSGADHDSSRAGVVPDLGAAETFRPQIVSALSSIYDPEIPVNIYELGLIYDIRVDTNAVVDIQMTLTAPACPSAQIIPMQVEQRVRDIPGIKDVHVAVVWEPPWTKDRMSDAAKLQLGIF